MKKVIILNIIILTMFVFIGCNSNDDAIINVSEMNETESIEVNTKDTELVLTNVNTPEEDVNEVITVVEKSKPHTYEHDVKNTISFTPHSVNYNDSDELIVTGYIKNETDQNVGKIRIRALEIYNANDELIASDSIGYLQHNLTLKPEASIEWTFTFPAMTVSITNDDLDQTYAIVESSNGVYK